MALVPTIPDALYIGATAVDRVYQGPEQIWPEAPTGLSGLILSHNPLHYWMMDEASGSAADSGSENLTLPAVGTLSYQQTIGNQVGILVDTADYFQVQWNLPTPPFTTLFFNEPVTDRNAQFIADVHGNIYAYMIRGVGTFGGNNSIYLSTSNNGGVYVGVNDRTVPGLFVARHTTATDTTISYYNVNNPAGVHNTGITQAVPALTGKSLRINAIAGGSVVSNVALIPSVLTDNEVAAIWAAFEA